METPQARSIAPRKRCDNPLCGHIYFHHDAAGWCNIAGCPCRQYVKPKYRHVAPERRSTTPATLAGDGPFVCRLCGRPIVLVHTRTERGQAARVWIHEALPTTVHPAVVND